MIQITIATEVGVFHDLAPLCIQAMKDSLFGIVHTIEDSDDEDDKPVEEEKLEKEAIEDVLSEAAAILTKHDDNKGGTGIYKIHF